MTAATTLEGQNLLTVRIFGPPCAQGRPRFTTRNGKLRAIDPPKSRAWKKVAAQLMAIEMRERGIGRFEGPVEMVVVGIWPLPVRQQSKRGITPRAWRPLRPDVENVIKAAMDAATGVLYADDAQVVRVFGEKWTAAQDEAPSVIVSVRALDPEQGR
jgi:Holliday junction resolvase RusA-like endonuclease